MRKIRNVADMNHYVLIGHAITRLQTYTQTHIDIDRQTDRQSDTETETQTHRYSEED